jgi:MFS family permease
VQVAPHRREVAGAVGLRLGGAAAIGAVALARADAGLVGALAPALRMHLGLSDGDIGLLASLAGVTGAVCALPGGILVDRRSRRVVLAAALVAWSLALGVAGLASGLAVLAVGRLVSGAFSGVARPAAVSVLGDTHPPWRRGRALARLDAAQSAGGAACYVVAAVAVAAGAWRAPFFVLAAAGVALAAGCRRLPGRVVPAGPPRSGGRAPGGGGRAPGGGGRAPGGGPAGLARILTIRTNLVVLAAESVGNFFFAGTASFAVLLATEHFGVPAATADALAPALAVAVICGILAGGRIGDRAAGGGLWSNSGVTGDGAGPPGAQPTRPLGRRGGKARGERRLVLAGAATVAGAALLAPAFLVRSLGGAAVFLLAGAALLGVSGPCVDAVRLDVVERSLRGRAEAARGILTLASTAAGPVVFAAVAGASGGLDRAFLVMLVPLAASGLLLLAARRTYAADVAAAGAAGVYGQEAA